MPVRTLSAEAHLLGLIVNVEMQSLSLNEKMALLHGENRSVGRLVFFTVGSQNLILWSKHERSSPVVGGPHGALAASKRKLDLIGTLHIPVGALKIGDFTAPREEVQI